VRLLRFDGPSKMKSQTQKFSWIPSISIQVIYHLVILGSEGATDFSVFDNISFVRLASKDSTADVSCNMNVVRTVPTVYGDYS
jgi:hypothetical protein